MAQEERDIVALVERATDAISRLDFDGFLAAVHPDVEFTSLVAEMEGETYRGHEGVRRWWADVRGAFEEGTWSYEHVAGEGDRAVGRLRIAGRLSGVPVDQTMWVAIRTRDGQAVWWGFFREQDEAHAAVGLEP